MPSPTPTDPGTPTDRCRKCPKVAPQEAKSGRRRAPACCLDLRLLLASRLANRLTV